MADFHAADLWVAVIPETSQVGPAMEKAGQEAKGKFGDGIKGIGKKVHEELDQVGAKAKEAFGKAGKTAGEIFSSEIGKELTNTAAAEIGKAVGEAVKDLPGIARGVELFQQWGSASQLAAGGIKGVSDAIRSAKVGDFTTALNGVESTLKNLEPVAKTFGVDISGWEGPLGDVQQKSKVLTDTYGDLKGNIEGTAKGFAGLTNDSGRIAGGLNAIAAAAGPLAATFAALDTLMPGFDQHLNNVLSQIQGKQGFNPKDWVNTLLPGTNIIDKAMPGPVSANSPIPAKPGVPVIPVPGSMPAVPDGYTAKSGSLDPFLALMPPGMAPPTATPGAPSSLAPIDMPDGAPRAPAISAPIPAPKSAAPSGFSVPLMQRPDGSWTSPNPAWAHLINRESGGNPSIFNTTDSNAAAGDPSQGLFQFTKATWARSGGLKYGPNPGKATPQQQAEIAANLIRSNPTGSDWGAGMSGRENARELLSGIGASSVSFGTWYPGQWGKTGLSDSGPSGGGGSSGGGGGGFRDASLGKAGVGPIPTGAEHDPLYVTQASSGAGGSGGGSPFESQGQQLGQGLVNGVLQMFGLDGSVFGGKSPLDWGAVKLGGGLLNYGMGLMNSMGGGPMGAPGLGGGGGGSMLSGLAGLIPHPGPLVSAGAGAPSDRAAAGLGAATGGATNYYNMPVNVTAANPTEWVTPAQFANNSTLAKTAMGTRYYTNSGGLPEQKN